MTVYLWVVLCNGVEMLSEEFKDGIEWVCSAF